MTPLRIPSTLLLASIAAVAWPAEEDGSTVIRWTDRAGTVHLTSDPPHEYEVTRAEWLRLKEEYPERVVDAAPELSEELSELTPGLRAEAALRDWWNIAGPKGGFRGVAVVTPEEEVELARLIAIAVEALREARGTDLSPATGRAASELRRARGVQVVAHDPERDQVPLEALFRVEARGDLVRGVSSTRYDVVGRVSNRSAQDATGLTVSLLLRHEGRIIATRELRVPRIMARGEAPLQATFDLTGDLAGVQEQELSLGYRVTEEGADG